MLTKDKLGLWVAQRMPRWLVYWCTIRLGAHATCGKWGHLNANEVTLMDALDRWNK